MTRESTAFLALWNDVDPARIAEYDAWHTFEHVPERVGVPGIRAGRRYAAPERSGQRYFTLYELERLETLDDPRYRDLVLHPTAWSASMRPSLRNFLRQPCRIAALVGQGRGASVATFRFSIDPAAPPRACVDALATFVESAAIVSLWLGRVEPSADFPLRNAPVAGDDAAAISHVAVAEGAGRAAVEAAAPLIAARLREQCGASPIDWETYDLVFACARADLRDPGAARQPPREDLRRHWQKC